MLHIHPRPQQDRRIHLHFYVEFFLSILKVKVNQKSRSKQFWFPYIRDTGLYEKNIARGPDTRNTDLVLTNQKRGNDQVI